jgi:hypothetical protein
MPLGGISRNTAPCLEKIILKYHNPWGYEATGTTTHGG